MEANNYIEEHIRQSLGEFELQPDVHSFHGIMQKLNQEKQRRRFIFFFWVGIGLILSSTGLYLFTSFNFTKDNVITEKKLPIIKADEIILKKENKSVINSIISQKKVNRKNILSSYNNSKTTNKKQLNSDEKSESQSLEEVVSNIPPKSENVSEKDLSLQNSVLFLQPISTIFHNERPLSEIMAAINSQKMPNIDSLLALKKNRMNFYVGINFNPQLNTYILTPNKNSTPIYSSNAQSINSYLNTRKKQNEPLYNYAYGLKFGMCINNKYEILLGLGYQRFRYKEHLAYNSAIMNAALPNTYNTTQEYGKDARYFNYALECSRLFNTNRGFRLKGGLVINVNQLKWANRVYISSSNKHSQIQYNVANDTYMSKFMFTTALKGGIIFNEGKRCQFQLCPNLFFAPVSMYSKDFVIKQKPIGAGLDCIVLFKLR